MLKITTLNIKCGLSNLHSEKLATVGLFKELCMENIFLNIMYTYSAPKQHPAKISALSDQMPVLAAVGLMYFLNVDWMSY